MSMISARILQQGGQVYTLSEKVEQQGGDHLTSLVTQLRKVQKDTNDFLTSVIVASGGGGGDSNGTEAAADDNGDDDDDEDGDDDSETKEPEEKIPKLF